VNLSEFKFKAIHAGRDTCSTNNTHGVNLSYN